MSRTRAPYESNKTVLDYSSPAEYVRNVLDSKSPAYKGGYETDGHALLAARYSNLKDENQKKLIAEAIVSLLDDPDYSCDAIPVAAECGFEEAKEWFLKLARKSIQELREIKSNSYTDGLGCLVVYSDKQSDFLPYLKKLLNNTELTFGERFSVLYRICNQDPNFVLNDIEKHLRHLNKNVLLGTRSLDHLTIDITRHLNTGSLGT